MNSIICLKVNQDEAHKAALVLCPGEVTEVEYEIESDGDPSYEFDIIDGDGKELKVEVSGITGKVIEVHVEQWQIGEEPGESAEN